MNNANDNSRQSSAQRVHPLEHRVPPPVLVVVTAIGMWFVARETFTLPLTDFARWITALPAALAGLSFLVLGFMAFRRAKTTIDPVRIDRATSLVTTGIFARTRNPMYVGFTLLLLAWACYLAAPLTLVGTMLFAAFIHHFQILPEEKILQRTFGEAFSHYCRGTRRWL